MPNYRYEATDSDGAFASGEIAADRVSDAIAELEAQGLRVESIRSVVPVPDLSLAKKAFNDRIDSALASRESLIAAMSALADEMPHRRVEGDVRQFISQLKSGANAQQIVAHESSAAWLPIIVRGLGANSTADGYGQLMDDARRESETSKSLRAVLAYPLFLFAFSMIVVIALAILVVPTFSKMYSEFGLSLPAATMLLFWISQQLTDHELRSLLVIMSGFLIVVLLSRLWIRFALSTRLLGLFTAGNAANLTAMAKFTGSLAEFISIEAPLPEAIRIAGRACQHRHFRIISETMAGELELPGTRLTHTSVAHNFPMTVLHGLCCGRDNQPNVPLLRELSRMYADRAQTRSNWSTSILGPISLIGLGLVIGFVIIALFMPLVSLVTALS